MGHSHTNKFTLTVRIYKKFYIYDISTIPTLTITYKICHRYLILSLISFMALVTDYSYILISIQKTITPVLYTFLHELAEANQIHLSNFQKIDEFYSFL